MALSDTRLYHADYYRYMQKNYFKRTPWSRDRIRNIFTTQPQDLRNQRILDVGAGMGSITFELLKRRAEVVSIDLSRLSLSLLKHSAACHGLGRPAAVSSDCAYFPFKANSFDGIICADLVEHIEPGTAQRLFADAYRAVKPGGFFLVYTPTAGHVFNRMREKRIILSKIDSHIDMKNMHQLQRDLRACGFSITHACYQPSHVPLWRQAEKLLIKVPVLGALFARRIYILCEKERKANP